MPQKKKKKNSSSRDMNCSSSNSSLAASEQQDPQEETDSPQLSQTQKIEISPEKMAELKSCLEELDQIIRGHQVTKADCVAGIKKVDEVLGECVGGGECENSDDVKCWLQLKRAQLLKIVFDKRYGSEGLASQHVRPLESCIYDCQQVLSALRGREEEASLSSDLYQETKTLLVQAKKLKREEDPEVRTRSGTAVSQSHHPTPVPLLFEPFKTQIKEYAEIHPILLQDVVNCYKKYKYVCRFCFIRYNRQEIVVGGKPCRRCKNTTTVRIMPASKLCKNFRDLKILAIPPPPKVLMAPTNRHKPFLYCRNDDHLLCYDRARESWYAHSVEELVVWNVERHYNCSFTEYVSKHHVDVAMAIDEAREAADRKLMENIDTFSDEQDDYEFSPPHSFFHGLSSIPKHLLDDIIKCYGERREYCKTCFYKMGKKGELSVGPQDSSICKLCRRPWQRVVVMPSSRLCWNFGDFDVIPIAPLPRAKTMSQYSSFKYCNNDDHYRCFRVYIENEFWYAHSVEEMVIWTVEREKDCTFSQFINKSRKPAQPPPGLTLPTSPPSQNHTPLVKSPTTTAATTTAQSTTTSSAPESDPALPDSAPPPAQGQSSSSKIPSAKSPSFSQVVVSGPPMKFRPPVVGKAKNSVPEKADSHFGDADSVSIGSNNSGMDGAGSGVTSVPRLASLVTTSSPPANASARATSPRGGAFDGLAGPPGNHPATSTTKTRHLSESSYMTALSQESVTLSHGDADLSQESTQSNPLKPQSAVAEGTAKTTGALQNKSRGLPKSATRGRPSFKVVQPMKTEGVERPKVEPGVAKTTDGGPTSVATGDAEDGTTNSNFVPSDAVIAELDYTSTECPSDNLSSQPLDHPFSPTPSDSTPLHLTSVATETGLPNRTTLTNRTPSTAVPNTGFASGQTSFASGQTGFGASQTGYRPSRPPGYSNMPAGVLPRSENLVNSNHQGFTPNHVCGMNVENAMEVFKFSLINFRAFSDVPLPLVVTIASSFEGCRDVCRKCFFGERSLCVEERGVCDECGAPWENPVTVIPSCKECNNEPCFDSDDHIPIHPLPPVANIRKCQLKNHHKCFQKSLESNPKFAHSIEQLVVWLIESEKDCSFQDFVNGELQTLMSHSKSDSTSHHVTGVPGLHNRQFSGGERTQHHHRQQGFIPSPGTGINASPSPTDLRPPHVNSHLQLLTPKYSSKNTCFEYVVDIPLDLMGAVALCYQYHKTVCRQCFFTSGGRQVTTARKRQSDTCSEGHSWKTLVIIPGCRLCSNTTHSIHVPILPLPRHVKENSVPFCVCRKSDHQQCFVACLTSDPTHPHSVEELVVWTVERERSVPFEKVFKSYLPGPDSHITPETVMILPTSTTVAMATTKQGGPGHVPAYRSSSTSSSLSVSRSSSDTASSRATLTHSNGVSTVAEHGGDSVCTDGVSKQLEPPKNSSRSLQHNTLVGDRALRDTSAGVASAGGESSDTSSVPGSSESVQSSLVSENAIPDQLSHPQMAGGSVVEQNGISSAPVSLFHDPLMFYGSNVSTVVPPSEHVGSYDSDEHDFTLDVFPALRQNATTATETGKHAASILSPTACSEPVANSDVVDLFSTGEIVKQQQATATASSEIYTHTEKETVATACEGHTKRETVATACEGHTKKETVASACEGHTKKETVASACEGHTKKETVASACEGEEKAESLDRSLDEEELLHAEHNRYRSSKSSARPENWPDVQEQPSFTKDEPPLTESQGSVIRGDNHQGQPESPVAMNSLGSSSGFVTEGAEEREDMSSGSDITKATEVTEAVQSSTQPVLHPSHSAEEKSPSEQKNDDAPAPPSAEVCADSKSVIVKDEAHSRSATSIAVAAAETGNGGPTASRRDSLDVNAKEFTPRSTLVHHQNQRKFSSGLNPNAAAVYPYITNGGIPFLAAMPPPQMINPAPTVPGVPMVTGGSLSVTRRKTKGQTQSVVTDPGVTSVISSISSSTITYPTSEISSSPTSSLSPPTSPSHPHKCLLCYQAFPDPPSLRRHCKTAAHISTLLRDCGASTIWKNLPPPPGQPREHMKLCVNGCNCTSSRLECIQPHFADEFAEQLRRVEHHNKREASRKPLPAFSDQKDGLLISPLEKMTQYTTLKVSVREPLKAQLTDSSASFTWTISVQGQNWQTLFGIHLKSDYQVFQITDLEDANAQVEGKCQSDRVNWVASSPADAILLGQLSFSVRASPKVNGNYECRVCLNLGFYQHAYISLALLVNDPTLTHDDNTPPLSLSLSDFPPIATADTKPRVQSAPYYKRSPEQSLVRGAIATPRPQSASSLPLDERDSASESDQLSQKSLKEMATSNHVQLSPPLSVIVGDSAGSGGAGGKVIELGTWREGESERAVCVVKTNGDTSDTSIQGSRESEKAVIVNSHVDHMISSDVIVSSPPVPSSSHV